MGNVLIGKWGNATNLILHTWWNCLQQMEKPQSHWQVKNKIFLLYDIRKVFDACKILRCDKGMNCEGSWQLCFVWFVVPLPAMWQVATHGSDSLDKFQQLIALFFSDVFSMEQVVDPHSHLYFIQPGLWQLPGLLVPGDPLIAIASFWNVEVCNDTILYTYLV